MRWPGPQSELPVRVQVVEAVKSPRSKKNAPVFQVLLLLQQSAPHKVVHPDSPICPSHSWSCPSASLLSKRSDYCSATVAQSPNLCGFRKFRHWDVARCKSHVQAVSGIGLLDLVLEVAQHGEQWHASLHYNTDLFDKATAQRMLGHFMVGLSDCYAAQTHSCQVLWP